MLDEVTQLLLESSLDEESRDYVAALVLEVDSEEDPAETLAGFLCDDGDSAVLARLLEIINKSSKSSCAPEPELRRLDQAVVMISTDDTDASKSSCVPEPELQRLDQAVVMMPHRCHGCDNF